MEGAYRQFRSIGCEGEEDGVLAREPGQSGQGYGHLRQRWRHVGGQLQEVTKGQVPVTFNLSSLYEFQHSLSLSKVFVTGAFSLS